MLTKIASVLVAHQLTHWSKYAYFQIQYLENSWIHHLYTVCALRFCITEVIIYYMWYFLLKIDLLSRFCVVEN